MLETTKEKKKFLKGSNLRLAIFIYTLTAFILAGVLDIIFNWMDLLLLAIFGPLPSWDPDNIDAYEETQYFWSLLRAIFVQGLGIFLFSIGTVFMVVFFVLVVTPSWEKMNNGLGLTIFIVSGIGMINFVFIPTWVMSFILWMKCKEDKNKKITEPTTENFALSENSMTN